MGGPTSAGERRPMCVNWRYNSGWERPHCGEPAENRPPGAELPGNGQALDADAYAGPADFCPLDLWAELEPIDLDALREASRTNRLAMQRKETAVQVRGWMSGLEGEAKLALLENLVEAGVLLPEIAEEVAVDEGLTDA
jgi:hypothetical protein